MARKSKRTPKNDEVFFGALANGYLVAQAASIAGYGLTQVYHYKKTDPDFARKWQYSGLSSPEVVEAEMDRRGISGWDEPKFYRDQQVGTVRKYSDALLLARAKALMPSKYGNKVVEETEKELTPTAEEIGLAVIAIRKRVGLE